LDQGGKAGRTDLSTIASSGRDFDEGLAAVIAGKLDSNSHLSVKKLAQSLGIAASKVCRHLTEVLGMKCRHLRWVPHTLTSAHKVMRRELAQSMSQVLAEHEHMNYHFLFTGDESWMFDAHDRRTR
jgi:AraC-like DNA-binding protein